MGHDTLNLRPDGESQCPLVPAVTSLAAWQRTAIHDRRLRTQIAKITGKQSITVQRLLLQTVTAYKGADCIQKLGNLVTWSYVPNA